MKNNNLPDTQSNSDNRNILINKAELKKGKPHNLPITHNLNSEK